MMRLVGFCVMACLVTTACVTRERTILPETEGVVRDLATGTPVQGVRVQAVEAESGDTTNAEGRFVLPLVMSGREARIVLPVSGVYRALAPVSASTADAHAHGAAVFISTEKQAIAPLTLFLIRRDAPYGAAGLPDSCTPADAERYSLQLLAAPSSPTLQAWYEADESNAFRLREYLRMRLIGGLGRRCEIDHRTLTEWSDRIATLTEP